MLALHLNAVDLSRTTVRSAPSVMIELAEAGERLMRQSSVPPHLSGWTARTRAALQPGMRSYLDLCTVPRWRPDFLTPTSLDSDFATALDTVLATPVTSVHAELQGRIDRGELPTRVTDLAAGDPRAMRRLRSAMEAFHDAAVAPYWTEIVAAVHADRAARSTTLVDHGIERVLHTLSPFLRWRSSTLSYECPGGVDMDLAPNGRGVTLVPSYLATQPGFLDVAGAPVILHYPIASRPPELTTRKQLADLLGRTRSSVLAAVADGRSTTEVATNIGISAASASQHTAVLRTAGLITTHRTGPSVRHLLTPLGSALLQTARRANGSGP